MAKTLPVVCVTMLLAAGCPSGRPAPRARAAGSLLPSLERGLVWPPTASVGGVLSQLARLTGPGSRRARWARLRYLFDLYDFARLTGDGQARELLLRAQGLTGREPKGPATTRLVAGRLLAGLEAFARQGRRGSLAGHDAVSGSPPGHTPGAAKHPRAATSHLAEALALIRLLRSDLLFLRDPKTLRARVALLKAALGTMVAPAARLRLYSICAQAFRAAVRAAPSRRQWILNHCIPVLYDFDPEPHLRTQGAPPAPPWTAYRDRLQRLLDAAAVGPRMSSLVGLRTEMDGRFYAGNGARLPVLLHRQIGDLPRLSGGRPYTGASALVLRSDQLLIGGRSILRPRLRHIRVALTEAFFAGNGQTHLTVFAPRSLPAGRLAPLLERATATGFYTVGLGGVQVASSRVGYWATRREVRPIRLREVVLSLAPISAAAATLKGLSPRLLGWDRACARHGLGVLLATRQATPYGPDGRLGPLLSPRSTAEALGLALARLRAAFPTACGLRISADPALSYADLLEAVASVGGKGWRWLGYATPPGIPASNTFPTRVAARLAARVSLRRWPRRLRKSRGDLRRLIRPCYLDGLDTRPTRWGVLEVHSSPTKTLVNQLRGTSPEELSMNGCVARAVTSWRRSHGVVGLLRFRVSLAR